MENRINKIFSTVALILMLTLTALIAGIQPSNAANTYDTRAFINVSPNTVGVGQYVLVSMWLSFPAPTAVPPLYEESWKDFQVNIVKPDGTNETRGPFNSYAVGDYFIQYTPTMIGIYKFQFTFPGQTLSNTNIYRPSMSNVVELTVQQEQVPSWKETPLPTDYWTRPIYGTNPEWSSIAGNWPMPGNDYTARFFDVGSATNYYTKAPNSAHILWTKPIDDGGIAGGSGELTAYYGGMSYQAKFSPPTVINGRLYYNLYGEGFLGSFPGFVAVDLRTGEELWRKTDVTLSFGQIIDYESPNQHGARSYLWSTSGTSWYMYDAIRGDLMVTIANATAGGVPVLDEKGNLFMYYLDGIANRYYMWSATKAIMSRILPIGSFFIWNFQPEAPIYREPIDWSAGMEWNVSIPDMPGSQTFRSSSKTYSLKDNVFVAMSIIPPDYAGSTHAQLWEVAYPATLQKDPNGNYPTSIDQLWLADRSTRQNLDHESRDIWTMLDYSNVEDGVYTYRVRDQLQTIAYDAKTGVQKWITDPTTDAFGMFPGAGWIAYGKAFTAGYDGKIRVYNLETGALLWTYFSGYVGYNTPYGWGPFYGGLLFADNKVFGFNSEHSPNQPIYKGARVHAVNIATGNGIWSISGMFTAHRTLIADGILVGDNQYDNQIYAFGKGQSKTTVSAPLTAVTQGQSVMLTGTVTDQSPGKPGTPAISDESMSAWMEYQYMQQPIPMNAKGVSVTLDALDSNGKLITIGTVTSDMSGMFKKLWTPEAQGEYTIIATFHGSESYYSSYAETAVGVTAAQASTSNAQAPTEWYTIGTGIAVIIAIAIVGILLLRKKP